MAGNGDRHNTHRKPTAVDLGEDMLCSVARKRSWLLLKNNRVGQMPNESRAPYCFVFRGGCPSLFLTWVCEDLHPGNSLHTDSLFQSQTRQNSSGNPALVLTEDVAET